MGTSQSPGKAASARDWDAVTYDRVSDPQVAWAGEVLERLPLAVDYVRLNIDARRPA
jgi:hypothetical protein